MGLRLLGAVVVCAFCVVSAAWAGPLTTAPTVLVKIHVTVSDSKVTVVPKHAPRGSEAQFIVRNVGKKPHTFMFGGTKRGVQSGLSRLVRPGEQKLQLLFLNYRGVLPYLSSTPADRNKPGMRGKFTVGE